MYIPYLDPKDTRYISPEPEKYTEHVEIVDEHRAEVINAWKHLTTQEDHPEQAKQKLTTLLGHNEVREIVDELLNDTVFHYYDPQVRDIGYSGGYRIVELEDIRETMIVLWGELDEIPDNIDIDTSCIPEIIDRLDQRASIYHHTTIYPHTESQSHVN